MARRNKYDHYADILKLALEGERKTHLVYKANLNFQLIKDRLKTLRENDLIRKVEDLYYATEKGKRWLDHYENGMEILINA